MDGERGAGMVRVFIYDADINGGNCPCEIVEYNRFTGKNFHELTRCFYALYEGLDIDMYFESNDIPFLFVNISVHEGKFQRKVIDNRLNKNFNRKGR